MNPREIILNIRKKIQAISDDEYEKLIIELAELLEQHSTEQIEVLRNSLDSFRY